MPSPKPASAGYSGTPLPKKLGIAAGKSQTILLVNAPKGTERLLADLPPDASLTRRASTTTPDLVLAFVTKQRQLADVLERHAKRCTGPQRLWLCWPKKTSDLPTEIGESDIRSLGLAAGLVDIKVCAIDADWSGLCFVRPVKNRATPARPARSPRSAP